MGLIAGVAMGVAHNIWWQSLSPAEREAYRRQHSPTEEERQADVEAAYAAAGARLRTLERRVRRKIRVLTKHSTL